MSDVSNILAGRRILVVDDEELVREVTTMMIEDAGGIVLAARDGTEGVEMFKAHHARLSAVFMDFSLPGLNGFEAFERIQAVDARVPVVIVSGLKITPEVEQARNAGTVSFLGKPFKQQDLIKAIASRIAAQKAG